MNLSKTALRPGEAHVVMLVQYLPLHFISTMQRLAEKVGRLTLVLSETMDSSRDWTPDYGGLNVLLQKSLSVRVRHRHPLGFEDDGKVIFPWSTLPDLARLKPDVVIAVEVGARTLQAFALRKVGAKFRLIVQVRESEITALSRGPARKKIRSWLLPRVDGVFVNGQSGRRHVRACGVDASRITVVPSGTDRSIFGSNPLPVRSDDATLRLLYVGQLIPRKGIMPFARVLAETARVSGRKIHFQLCGRGPQQAEISTLPWPDNVTVEFRGSLPYRDLPAAYQSAHALVMPSLADEWGLVVNEAMASGLPILGCSGAQSIEELVHPGVSGWIYPPTDEGALRSGLQTLLSTSLSRLAEMGAAARKVALTISDEYAAQAIIQGIEQVLAGKTAPRRLERWNRNLPVHQDVATTPEAQSIQ